MGAELLM